MQLTLFETAPRRRDIISEDAVSHWKHMVATDGKKWPYLLPYYQAMLEFNRRRLALGWDNAGPMPTHPDGDDNFEGAILPVVVLPTIGYLVRPCGEWHRYCKGWTGFDAVLPVSWEVSCLERA